MRISWKILMIVVCVVATYRSWAQYNMSQNKVWAFGNNIGVDFNQSVSPSLAGFITAMKTNESSASVSDENGQLLFYTEGSNVWDRNHNLMPNGSQLVIATNTAGLSATSSTTQGALIVPMPDDINKYYIFSLTAYEEGANVGNLYYSIIDMNLNGGNGDVVPGQKGVFLASGLSEKMMAVQGDRCNMWVVARSMVSPQFKVWELTNGGLNTTPVISSVIGLPILFGEIKVAPNRRKIAATNNSTGLGLIIYDFDAATGIVSNPLTIDGGSEYYGAEFSSNSTKLYAHNYQYDLNGDPLYQFDLTASNPSATKTLIGLSKGDLKLAPDGKIYAVLSNKSVSLTSPVSLGVINFPDLSGAAVQYDTVDISFSNLPMGIIPSTYLGLPNVVPVFVRDTTYTAQADTMGCFVHSVSIGAKDLTGWDYLWSDGLTNAIRDVVAPGTYWVTYHTAPCVHHTDTFHVASLGARLPSVVAGVAGCKVDTTGRAWVIPAIGDTATYTYIWRDAGNNILQGPLQGNNGDSLYNVAQGTYSLQIIKGACDTTLYLTLPPPSYKASFTADTLVCINEAINFQNTSEGGFVQWQWDFGDQLNDQTQNPIHSYAHAGTYVIKLIAATDYPCYDTAYQTIVVDTQLAANFMMDTNAICAGRRISFSPQMDTSAIKLLWTFGDGSYIATGYEGVDHVYTGDGSFVVKLEATFRACADTAYSDTIHVYPYPVVNLGPDTGICLGQSAIILANLHHDPFSDYNMLWSTGAVTGSINANAPGEYWLNVTNNGCATVDSILITPDCYLAIPNAFTPNGDGVNDHFFPRELLTKGIKEFHMQVYNRWGTMIFETNTTNGRGWDGTFNGAAQSQGVYIYVIEVAFVNDTHKRYKGSITLIR